MADAGPLSHRDDQGAAHVVDVTGKAAAMRTAVAAGSLRTSAQVVELIAAGGLAKGDALATCAGGGHSGRQAHQRPDSLVSTVGADRR